MQGDQFGILPREINKRVGHPLTTPAMIRSKPDHSGDLPGLENSLSAAGSAIGLEVFGSQFLQQRIDRNIIQVEGLGHPPIGDLPMNHIGSEFDIGIVLHGFLPALASDLQRIGQSGIGQSKGRGPPGTDRRERDRSRPTS